MDATVEYDLSGAGVHGRFKQMTQAYGVMMAGVPAATLGVNQAAMQAVDTTEGIDNAVLTAKDDMLEPSNSCGDQSNQVCQLFLGAAGAKVLSDMPYAVLSTNGSNLLEQIGTHDENFLIRFEVDRALTIGFISIDQSIKNLDELTKKVDSDKDFRDRLIHHRGVVLVDGDFYQISPNATSKAFKPHIIPSTEDKRQQLRDLCKGMGTDTDGADEIYIESPDNETQIKLVEEFTLLNKNAEDMWASSHSFTTFIPPKPASTTRHPYQYQAYFGSHTLEEWLSSPKSDELSASTLDQYVSKLYNLSHAKGGDEVLRHEMGLFSLGGTDETRLLQSATACPPQAMRVKFKVASVDPAIVHENLSALQAFFNADYKGSTPKEQVLAYGAEANRAMTKCLEEQLEARTVGSQKNDQAAGVLKQKNSAFKEALQKSTEAAQGSSEPLKPT